MVQAYGFGTSGLLLGARRLVAGMMLSRPLPVQAGNLGLVARYL